ncbi:MAG: hypothetical protein EA349_09135 [Halomonadaceae bacterium]|nr:MAG: hypothetical protein EA349_09135 [Halomonadaceae bacterium]
MKTAMRYSLLLLAVLLLAACGGGEPTLNTDSDEAMESSYGEMTAGMSEEEHQQFDEALGTIYMMGALEQMDSGKNEAEVLASINASVHGKSVSEIRDMAQSMEGDMQKQLEQMQEMQGM